MSATSAISPFSSAHKRYVQQLYRKALRDALDWTVHRDLYRQEALKIRAQFEANRHVTEPRAVAKLLHLAEKEIMLKAHPDPSIIPTAPGGIKHERNLPPVMFTKAEREEALWNFDGRADFGLPPRTAEEQDAAH